MKISISPEVNDVLMLNEEARARICKLVRDNFKRAVAVTVELVSGSRSVRLKTPEGEMLVDRAMTREVQE